jgi:hypothetical protein
MAFLHKAGYPVVPEKGERDAIYRDYFRRFAIQEADGTWWKAEIERFADFMDKLNKEFAAAGRRKYDAWTTRGYLQMAIDFFRGLPPEITDARQITDEHATAFLARRSYIHGSFITLIEYLNHVVRLFRQIRIKKRKTGKQLSKFMPQTLREQLIREWRKAEGDRLVEATLCLVMVRYAQSAGQIAALRAESFREENGTLYLKFAKQLLPAPERDAKLFRRYLVRRAEVLAARGDEGNPYLFPSRYHGRAMTTAAIIGYPKKYKLNSKVLRGSALRSFFLKSDAPPKMAVECFGVDLSTAIRYFKQAATEIRADMKVHEAFEEAGGEFDGSHGI